MKKAEYSLNPSVCLLIKLGLHDQKVKREKLIVTLLCVSFDRTRTVRGATVAINVKLSLLRSTEGAFKRFYL